MARMLWTQREDIGPQPHRHPRMAYDEARHVITLVQNDKTSETWLWDGQLWVQISDIGPTYPDGLVWDPIRNLLVATTADSLWEWSGTEWIQVSDQRTGQGSTTFDERSKQLLRVTTILDSPCATWTWKDSEWTQIDAKGPPRRANFELQADRQRGVIVLIGGQLAVGNPLKGYAAVRDTWIWDGKWKAVSHFGPSERVGMSVAFDRARSQTVIFGGIAATLNDSYLNDTWEWDGTLWRQTQDMGPSRRSGAVMAYDAKRNRTVLFGGEGPNQAGYSDTWEYFDYSS